MNSVTDRGRITARLSQLETILGNRRKAAADAARRPRPRVAAPAAETDARAAQSKLEECGLKRECEGLKAELLRLNLEQAKAAGGRSEQDRLSAEVLELRFQEAHHLHTEAKIEENLAAIALHLLRAGPAAGGPPAYRLAGRLRLPWPTVR